MDLSKLNQGEKIAGVGGIVLLISLWLSWYSINGINGVNVSGFGNTSGNAWDAFSIIQIILFLTALAAIGAAVIKGTDASINLPVAASAIVAGLGVFSVVLIIFRILSKPDFGAPSGFHLDVSLEFGIFVGLLSAAAVAYGGYMGMQEEGTSFGEEAGKLGG